MAESERTHAHRNSLRRPPVDLLEPGRCRTTFPVPAMLHKRLLSEAGECSLMVLKRDLQISCHSFPLCLALLNPALVWTCIQIFNTETVRVH